MFICHKSVPEMNWPTTWENIVRCQWQECSPSQNQGWTGTAFTSCLSRCVVVDCTCKEQLHTDASRLAGFSLCQLLGQAESLEASYSWGWDWSRDFEAFAHVSPSRQQRFIDILLQSFVLCFSCRSMALGQGTCFTTGLLPAPGRHLICFSLVCLCSDCLSSSRDEATGTQESLLVSLL